MTAEGLFPPASGRAELFNCASHFVGAPPTDAPEQEEYSAHGEPEAAQRRLRRRLHQKIV